MFVSLLLRQTPNDLCSRQANFDGSYPFGKAEKGPYLGRPTRVGSYAPNKLGLYDMHGNVWEWCQDLYEEAGSVRVRRGGSGFSDGAGCRASGRYGDSPSGRNGGLGF